MANRSYCRFENTVKDLSDCEDNILYVLTKSEHMAREALVQMCKRIADQADLVPDKPIPEEDDEEETAD